MGVFLVHFLVKHLFEILAPELLLRDPHLREDLHVVGGHLLHGLLEFRGNGLSLFLFRVCLEQHLRYDLGAERSKLILEHPGEVDVFGMAFPVFFQFFDLRRLEESALKQLSQLMQPVQDGLAILKEFGNLIVSLLVFLAVLLQKAN